MEIDNQSSDQAVLEEMGARLTRRRLDLQLSQAALARESGVSKRTIERLEAGRSAQLVSLIRVLRALGLLAGLEETLPPATPRPMDLLRFQGRARQRATGRRGTGGSGRPWRWGDRP